ncbi:MAG: histone H1-like repetitive region-containing protein [Myxococcales bacterium]|nr:histone H1-like repetitive region-containing protein [Myxococcales bacterium]
MQRSPSQFDDFYRQRLGAEQRRAVLEVLANELDPETTIGEVIDAAEDIGWGDELGELCLAELAGVLVPDALRVEVADATHAPAEVADDELAAEDEADEADEADEEDAEDAEYEEDEEDAEYEEDEEDEVVAAPPSRAKKASAKKTAKKTAKKAVAKKTAAKKTAAKKTAAKKTAAKKTAAKKTAAKKTSAKKTAAKKTSAKKAAPAAAELDSEAMSLDQAAKVLLPLVRRHKEATMQALEESTGMGRRKLRFHIGQLVKHGRLRRHGMGRGTYYTVVR